MRFIHLRKRRKSHHLASELGNQAVGRLVGGALGSVHGLAAWEVDSLAACHVALLDGHQTRHTIFLQ